MGGSPEPAYEEPLGRAATDVTSQMVFSSMPMWSKISWVCRPSPRATARSLIPLVSFHVMHNNSASPLLKSMW